MGTESRIVVARGWGGEGMETTELLLMEGSFSFTK